MSATNAFNTLTAETTGVLRQMPDMVNFLVNNRRVRLDDSAHRTAFATKTLLSTPISQLCERFSNDDLLRLFSLIHIPAGTKVPELMDFRHVVFDMYQLKMVDSKLYHVVAALPEFRDKIIINVTSMYSQKTGQITDMSRFQGELVRGMLSRLFAIRQPGRAWIPLPAIDYLAKIFSIALGNVIATNNALDMAELQLVKTIITYYAIRSNLPEAQRQEVMVKIGNRVDLGGAVVTNAIVDEMIEKYGDHALSLDELCTALQDSGIARLKKRIDRRYITTISQRFGGVDVLTTMEAIDYPPFWVYLVLLALSSRKTGLFNSMKVAKMDKDSDILMNALRTVNWQDVFRAQG